MTIDKIKHYLGENLYYFIGSLNQDQLKEMKIKLLNDISFLETTNDKSEILFQRNVELQFINLMLA